jgi:putative SOS response-associated peptidase YedK
MVAKLGRPLKTEGEVCPTDIAPVIAPDNNHSPTVFPMIWGFTNPRERGKPLVNCRVETAGFKPFWKESWQRRRCIIPCSYYFEWEHFKSADGRVKTGDKYAIQPRGCTVTWLCGLYRIEDGYPVFVVLTKEPTAELSKIHDRMPLMLPKERIDEWISPASDPAEIVPFALSDMVMEKAGVF